MSFCNYIGRSVDRDLIKTIKCITILLVYTNLHLGSFFILIVNKEIYEF